MHPHQSFTGLIIFLTGVVIWLNLVFRPKCVFVCSGTRGGTIVSALSAQAVQRKGGGGRKELNENAQEHISKRR